MSPLQALANYLDRQKRDLSGWVSNPSAQLERNVSNWTTPREGVIRQGGLTRAAVDPSNTFANPGNWMGAGIIKSKGGNWIRGSVEDSLDRLKHRIMDPAVEPDLVEEIKGHQAVNDWIDKQLTRYVKNDMATEGDPIRKLAEQDITHFRPEFQDYEGNPVQTHGKQLGVSHQAKLWENASDNTVSSIPVGELSQSELEPWMNKVSPETLMYRPYADYDIEDLGFDHIVDSINHHLESGIYTPDTLNNLSIERAVRDTHQWNQEMAAKMQESQGAVSSFGTVHKDYGDGMKWVELSPTGDKPALENALKYEGDTMGHCVGGYCDNVISGRSKIYSLRDAKNQPHVTIETEPLGENSWSDIVSSYPEDLVNQLDNLANANPNVRGLGLHALAKEQGVPVPDLPSSIVQIKGKQNAKPVDKYLPYVHDFIKSGKWGDIGDYQNTELVRRSALTQEEQAAFPDQQHFTMDEVNTMRQGRPWTPLDNDPEMDVHPGWLMEAFGQ